ncbi:MAG: TIM barrel protein, partial [Chloroflexota bacterium]
MKLGAVVSTAGGLHLAFERADELEFDSFMIITKSNRQWFAKPIDTEQLEAWQSERAANPHLDPIAAHAGYLINLASPRDDLYSKSYRSLLEEWDRAELLEIPTLTFHPGSHVGSGEEAGMERISRALSDLL